MEKILSNGELYHMVFRVADFEEGRQDLIEPNQHLQCAAIQMPLGKTFKPHKHIYKFGPNHILPQESWVVIKGSVKVFFYGKEDTIICETILNVGDASFTLQGAHNYEALEEGTLVLEYKNGPYLGVEKDKIFIE